MKNKTQTTEFKMVEHFLKVNGKKHAWINAVHAQVVTDRQMKQSLWNLLIYFFGFIALCGVFNNIEIPYNRKIADTCIYLAIASFVFFAGRVCVKLWSLSNFCGYSYVDNGTATTEILKVISAFKKLFGKRPEKLGRIGVAKKLTAVAKRVLTFKAKVQSVREFYERERLKKMYNVAKALLPVPRYEDLYAAAEAGAEMPPMIPVFN